MHQSFTGSARRSRQVNLSGRTNANPWAALSGPSSQYSAAPNPVAQAQAGRVEREQRRKKESSAKNIQRVWRGHCSRQTQKAIWRRTWDENESRRAGCNAKVDYQALIDSSSTIPVYETPAQLLLQLRLLLRYQDYRRAKVRDKEDTFRLLYLGEAVSPTLRSLQDFHFDEVWRINLSRLGMVVARHLKSTSNNESVSADSYGPRLLKMIAILATYVADDMTRDSSAYFEALEPLLRKQAGDDYENRTFETMQALLRFPTRKQPAYLAFAAKIMTQPEYSKDSVVLSRLVTVLDINELSLAITQASELEDVHNTSPLATTDRLWQLAYLVYFHDAIQRGTVGRAYVEALSTLLGDCADQIAERLGQSDLSMHGNNIKGILEDFPLFVRDMVARIPLQDNLQAVLKEMNSVHAANQGARGPDFESAKRLANFAVALLRAYPAQAQNIRMSLYQGSFTSLGNQDVSTIQYFWSTTRATGVFKKITHDHRNVLSLLREAAPVSNQIGQPPISKADISQWRDEWRIILLFLELYTFVLKFMDDQEFFSHDSAQAFGTTATSQISLLSRKGSLPLNDVALMTTFLKNLAFVLYWNAADLVDSNDHNEDVGISALFGNASQPNNRHQERKHQTLTGNGVSQGYLKGLVTGLLRMLHERDSRRAFVPAGHWLMTSQVNMAAFIPEVVKEEERRHELGDEDQEEEQEEGDDDQFSELDASGTMPANDLLLSTMFGIRPSHIPRSRASRSAGRVEKLQMQARKKRQLESLAPRLEILRNLPFFIPFETRVEIFRHFVNRDQHRRRGEDISLEGWRRTVVTSSQGRGLDGGTRALEIFARHHAEIRRESVFEDAYEAFHGLGEGLKEPIVITFIDQFGAPEAGIDGGGVTKEFLISVTSEAFDPDASLAMFKENSQRYLYPSPLIYQETAEFLKRAGRKPGTENYEFPMAEFLRRFQFLGRVVGKCLYEGILIDVSFAGFFLLKWALTGGTTVGSNESAYRATINDVREFDEELYQGLLKLKNYSGDVENDFGLDFTVTDTIDVEDESHNEVRQTVTKELIPNGANIPVTNTNRLIYIDRIVRYRLQQQPKAVTDAFLQGLGQIIQPMWLAMFNQKELQKLVGGDNTELDIADLRRNTLYGGLYVIGDDGQEHPTVQLFWKALQDMSDGDRRKVLKFVTSTPRAPLLGFSHLNPKFCIRDSSEDQDRLPSTSTCVNLLKLPRYGDLRTMKEKLLYAVNSGAGFDLS